MTVSLSLSPEIEEGLLARAEQKGVSLDYLLQEIVSREVGIGSTPKMSGEEKARAFVEWAESHRHTTPLSDEAIDRSNLYPEQR